MAEKNIKKSQWIAMLVLVAVAFVLYYGGPACNKKFCVAIIKITNNTARSLEVALWDEDNNLDIVYLDPGQSQTVQVQAEVDKDASDFQLTWRSRQLEPGTATWTEHKNGAFIAVCGETNNLTIN